MSDRLPPLDLAGRMGLAVAMGVVMGLAFEGVYKREERTSPGGIRTFPMLAVLGIVLYLLEPKTLAPYLAGLVAVAIWLYAHIRNEPVRGTPKPGLMVPAANLLAYAFGPLALTQPAWLVVSAAVAAMLLLESREALHRWVLHIPSAEVFTLGKFLILVGIVLPLVPDHPIVAWTPITPFKAWLALVAVSSLSYASYLLQRYLPERSGALWSAILGGAYSSTATTVALARQQRQLPGTRSDLEVGIIAATAVMYLRIDIVVAFFNARLAWVLLPALAGSFALASGIAGWRWLRRSHDARTAAREASLESHDAPAAASKLSSVTEQPAAAKLAAVNPLQLGTAVTFAALFVVLAIASGWVNRTFGQSGVYGLAALTGVTDIDPFVLSLAQGGVAGMSLPAVGAAILIAAASNNVLKACYALIFGGVRTARGPAAALLALAAVGLGLALLYLH